MTPEEMNAAMTAAGVCWARVSGAGVVVRDSSHPNADGSLRNNTALRSYVHWATVAGITADQFAAALRSKLIDGDRTAWDSHGLH